MSLGSDQVPSVQLEEKGERARDPFKGPGQGPCVKGSTSLHIIID